ncbi:hypothetical protein SDC9_182616 [bioreactor metagenome]|uniref:Uncharacterized protein n=1 Tax=bioreactor metagenome TaxID=1076179 RepID=A0A645H7W7_9ZZZZ
MRIILVIYQNFSMGKELQFFCYFLLLTDKVFLMGIANVRKNPDGRTHNMFELSHLSRHGNTGFENTQLRIGSQLPNRQRNANLRIIATWRTNNFTILVQKLEKPFLHDCFTVTAGNPDDRYRELPAMCRSNLLQSHEGIIDQ